MNRDQYRRLKEVFAEANELPVEERRAFLKVECGDDSEVFEEARAMLAVAPDASSALDQALAGDGGAGLSSALELPKRIAGYRIRRICGHGGMGTVYEAEQDAPKRRVALKVIQVGLLRDDTLRRFRREAEILGRLQHTGIAQVFEAGEFELQGATLPFFAMEFVEGLNIVDYATSRRLGVDRRIELFALVCDAVHYAHEKGVVHRDLKPDNVLVIDVSSSGELSSTTTLDTTAGQPKILDFGVARLVDSDLQATISTGAGQLLGSVPYMSPEQASARPDRIDRRSDVYALGVLLYELLAGRLPYEVKEQPLTEALTTVQEKEALRLGAIVPACRGDLETIVGKCLEKDPDWRYATVAELAQELRRYQLHEPILARPPSAWYQLRKFARRNRVLVGGSVATLTALAIGLVVAIVFALRAARNEELALHEAYRAKLTAADVLVEVDPQAARRTLESAPVEMRGWEWRYLNACLSPVLLEFGSHVTGSPLVAVDGGQGLLAARDQDTLALWDLRGREVAAWSPPEPATAWALSGDGRFAASGSASGRVYVLERSVGTWATWRKTGAAVVGITFAPDATRVAILEDAGLEVGRPGAWKRVSFREGVHDPIATFDNSGETILVATRGQWGSYLSTYRARDLEPIESVLSDMAFMSIQFLPGDERILASTNTRPLHFFGAETLKPADSWLGHTEPVDFVTHAEYGVISVARDNTLRLWSHDGEVLDVLPAEAERAVFLGPDRIVTAGAGRLQLWDLNVDARQLLADPQNFIYELAFSADGALLAASAPFDPSEFYVWDAFTGRLLRREPTPAFVNGIVASNDGRLALGSWAWTDVHAWYTSRHSRSSPPGTLTLSRNERFDAVTFGNQSVELNEPNVTVAFRCEHDLTTGRESRLFIDGAEAQLSSWQEQAVDPGSHPRLFVGNRLNALSGLDGSITDLIFYDGKLSSEDARAVEDYLAAREHGEAAVLPEIASARRLAHFRADRASISTRPTEHDSESVDAVVGWRSTGNPAVELEAVGAPLWAALYRPAADSMPERIEFGNRYENARWFEVAFPEVADVEHLSVFWLGHFSGLWEGSPSTPYSIGTIAPQLADWPGWSPAVRWSSFEAASHDGSVLAFTRQRKFGPVRVRRGSDGALLGQVDGKFWGVAMHPDGSRVACTSEYGDLSVYDTRSFECLGVVQAHEGTVYAVDWSPDGQRIATGGNDTAIRLWDAETLKPMLELRGHRQYVKCLSFSPDGSALASGSGDGTVRLWHTKTPAERYLEALERVELEDEVRPRVEAWQAQHVDLESVAQEIRAAWPSNSPRRQAAFTVLAHANRTD